LERRGELGGEVMDGSRRDSDYEEELGGQQGGWF
jgi:hypothetical protein